MYFLGVVWYVFLGNASLLSSPAHGLGFRDTFEGPGRV